MLISVLIPSRGRPYPLGETVDSLLYLADKEEDIQILARIDEEDPWYGRYLDPRVHFVRGPQLEGYKSMATFWNELAAKARGEWFFCMNDDALMLTPNWDRIVRGYDPNSLTKLIPHDNSTTNGWPAFPIFPREVYDKLGHITLFAGLDTWLKYLWDFSDLPKERIPVNINHRRPHMDDTTMVESAAASKELCIDFDVTRRDVWRDLIREDARKLCE